MAAYDSAPAPEDDGIDLSRLVIHGGVSRYAAYGVAIRRDYVYGVADPRLRPTGIPPEWE